MLRPFLRRLYYAVIRVIPNCVTQTQAVAFNMFLAFFPILLVVLGGVASSAALREDFDEILIRLQPVLPPGTLRIINSFLTRHSVHPWQWVLLGLGGTLLAGTQMMKLLMEGFRMVHGDAERQNYFDRHFRALLLLLATIVPSVLFVNLIVFGKQLRGWMLHVSSMPLLIRFVWAAMYVAVALPIAMLVLAVIYRLGRSAPRPWRVVVPGAAVATLLWWVVSAALGYYLRHVPYSLVYGGLAVTIGLMLWMQLTATVLLIGDAYNAELERPLEPVTWPESLFAQRNK